MRSRLCWAICVPPGLSKKTSWRSSEGNCLRMTSEFKDMGPPRLMRSVSLRSLHCIVQQVNSRPRRPLFSLCEFLRRVDVPERKAIRIVPGQFFGRQAAHSDRREPGDHRATALHPRQPRSPADARLATVDGVQRLKSLWRLGDHDVDVLLQQNARPRRRPAVHWRRACRTRRLPWTRYLADERAVYRPPRGPSPGRTSGTFLAFEEFVDLGWLVVTSSSSAIDPRRSDHPLDQRPAEKRLQRLVLAHALGLSARLHHNA